MPIRNNDQTAPLFSMDFWLSGMAPTLVEAAGVVGVMISGYLSDILGRREVLLVSLICAPLIMIGLVFIDDWLRYAAPIATGFTLLSTSPVMLAIVQDHCSSSPGAANGYYTMVQFMARSSVVVIVGFMGDLIGLRTAYLVSALLGLAGIPFILLLPRESEI